MKSALGSMPRPPPLPILHTVAMLELPLAPLPHTPHRESRGAPLPLQAVSRLGVVHKGLLRLTVARQGRVRLRPSVGRGAWGVVSIHKRGQ